MGTEAHSSATYLSSVQREQTKMPISQLLPGRDLAAYVTTKKQRVQLLISLLTLETFTACVCVVGGDGGGEFQYQLYNTFFYQKVVSSGYRLLIRSLFVIIIGLFIYLVIYWIPLVMSSSSPQCAASDVPPQVAETWVCPQLP